MSVLGNIKSNFLALNLNDLVSFRPLTMSSVGRYRVVKRTEYVNNSFLEKPHMELK